MKKRVLIAFLALMAFALFFTRSVRAEEVNAETDSEIVAEGVCGDNLTWQLDADYFLTISGSGDMWDFSQDSLPEWTGKGSILYLVVEEGVSSIGDYAFSDCLVLRSISLPEGLTRIGDYAFYHCVSLRSGNFPTNLAEIGAYAFSGCTSFTDLALPDGVNSIGNHAFDGCSMLRSFTLPSGLTKIGDGLFSSCGKLETIDIPEGVTTIGASAFEYCSSLTEIRLPEGVTRIGSFAFSDCTDLTEITFAGPAPTIGAYVFYNVTATAYYFADDSWTDSVKRNYGGTITWQPVGKQDFSLTVGSGEGQPEDVVPILVRIKENPGLSSATFAVDYDQTNLELSSISNYCPDVYIELNDNELYFSFLESGKYYVGDLIALEFTVLDEAAEGTYEVSLSKTDDFNPVSEETDFGCVSGSLTVAIPEVNTLTLNPESLTIPCYNSAQLTPDTGGVRTRFRWASSDETIATVDKNGLVTAHKYGKATITVTIPRTDLSASSEVQTLFWDVADSSAYYFRHVYWAANHTPYAITKGYSLERFEPETECSRKDMMTFLWRLAGQPEPAITSNPFPDVKKGSYYYKAVLWGVEKGITNGYSSGEYAGQFGIDLPCTREQAMTFLWRMAGKPNPVTTTNKFSDVKKSDYFYKAVLWASENKIANGYADGTYGVGLPCLREHMVTFLSRFAEKY